MHSRLGFFTSDAKSMRHHQIFSKLCQKGASPTKEKLTISREFWHALPEKKLTSMFDMKLKDFDEKNDLASRMNKEPQTDQEIDSAL